MWPEMALQGWLGPRVSLGLQPASSHAQVFLPRKVAQKDPFANSAGGLSSFLNLRRETTVLTNGASQSGRSSFQSQKDVLLS